MSNVTQYKATWNGHVWNVREIEGDPQLRLFRTCTGCWSEGQAGRFSTRRHQVEETVTREQIAKRDATLAVLRGDSEFADAELAEQMAPQVWKQLTEPRPALTEATRGRR